MENGLVQVYIGDGKGKSTAAFGLALRCYGCGGKALVLQFLKTWASGEVEAIQQFKDPRLQVLRFESEHDLVFDDPTELDMKYLKRDIQKAYLYALDAASAGVWDVLILDEILWALHFGFLSLENILALIQQKSSATELVLTGRNAPDEVLALADYITVMQAKKHPYEKGVDARRGIEF